DELAGTTEAARIADLGEQVTGEDRADTPDRLQRAQTAVVAGELAQLAVELGDPPARARRSGAAAARSALWLAVRARGSPPTGGPWRSAAWIASRASPRG